MLAKKHADQDEKIAAEGKHRDDENIGRLLAGYIGTSPNWNLRCHIAVNAPRRKPNGGTFTYPSTRDG